MSSFLQFSRRLVRDRLMLVAAMVFAVISAVGMGVGLLSMIPILRLIVDDAEAGSLPALALRLNAEGHAFAGVPLRVPTWIIERLPEDRFMGVVLVIAGIAVLTVVGATCNFVHQYLSITVATRTVANARLDVFRTAIAMPLVRVGGRGASEFVSRIVRDSEAVQRGLIAIMSKAITHTTQAVVMFMVAIAVGRSMTLAALLVVPVLAVFLKRMGKRIRRGTRGALERQEDLLRIANESLQGLRAVKVNTAEREATDRFDAMNQEAVHQELRARLARAISSPIAETIAVLAIGGLVIVAAREILVTERFSIARFLVALGALAVAGSKLKMLAGLINEVQAASAPARRLLDILDEPPEEPAAPPRPALARHTRDLRFEGIRFAYPGQTTPALAGVDLTVRHGERLAVVGPNGCGKTTLLSLLPRLITPDTGRVLIDGTDIATVSLPSLRRQVGVVTQETVLFRGTIADNIRFGWPDATDEEVADAARRAHAHEFISQLPGAYAAAVTEQGASLSGGQRQRLCIARAILRDPSILILDEATSQIDAESEAHINAAVAEFCRGRTVLLIAHRMATVLDADRIVVMNEGRIVDDGSHGALLDRCELYGRLFRTQLIPAVGGSG